jgi:DNA-directed RNA polymerase subunit E'/Rpb7
MDQNEWTTFLTVGAPPIIRGMAGKKTEFGAKISISDDNGFVDVDRISWDNFPDSGGDRAS